VPYTPGHQTPTVGAAVHVRRKSAAVFVFLIAAAIIACLPAVAAASGQQQFKVAAGPSTLSYGSVTTLTVQGAGSGAALTVSRKRAGDADFVHVASATAAQDGTASWRLKPSETTLYRVDQAAGAAWDAASAEVSVGVRPLVTLTATARTPLLETQRVRYVVSVRPAQPGATVQLTRRSGDAWVPLREITLRADSVGTVRLPAGMPGTLEVRAEVAADAGHLAGRSLPWRRTVYDKSNPWGVPTKYPHLILVSVHHYKLYYYEHGVVIRVFDCVTGRPSLPTPLGHFHIYAKDPHIGGPYGPYRMRYLGLFAIHGTDEPWLLSKYPRNFSHGCTRLSNGHISWLYPRVPVGTPVWNVP
jgi:lipoprotein-anchoring transpeptidase ErfK/SrfK